jgi:DNA end-binding protein Ku
LLAQQSMRAMWKASLELGKLHVPVKLYAAVEERKIHFRLLHGVDRVPVAQRMVDPRSGEEVPPDEIRRGVEIEPGVFVVIDDEEQDAGEPKPSRAIEVTRVVPRDALDIAWFERPYYLGPDGDAAHYAAIARVLGEGDQLGIARWVMRGKRYFGALEGRDSHLALIAMHTADEVVTARQLEPPSGPAISRAERELGEQLVSALAGEFDPSELRDEYRERVEKLIAAKRRGKRYAVKESSPPRAAGDLGSALRRSIQAAKGGRRAAA